MVANRDKKEQAALVAAGVLLGSGLTLLIAFGESGQGWLLGGSLVLGLVASALFTYGAGLHPLENLAKKFSLRRGRTWSTGPEGADLYGEIIAHSDLPSRQSQAQFQMQEKLGRAVPQTQAQSQRQSQRAR